MSSVIMSILSSTVGLLRNKARDTTAEKLKDGDITDEKLRELVVRELDDIKAKLDGISRKDMLSSCQFLQEGVDLLNVSLNKSKNEQKALLNETEDERGETSRTLSGAESGFLNEALALSDAMGRIKVTSDKEFESAKKRFRRAREKATEAFFNEALSIKDRIFAAKLRIVSEILECLECPETGITGCLSFLKTLHSQPAIQQMFSVYLNGGLKSRLNKAERVENVKSIMLINYVLFQVVSKLSKNPFLIFSWPTIECSDASFRPLLHSLEIATRKSMGDELTHSPNVMLIGGGIWHTAAVNGHCQVVYIGKDGDAVEVISRTGESKLVKLPVLSDGQRTTHGIYKALAVGNDNNIYVIRRFGTPSEMEDGAVTSYVLNVLDENYNVKHECSLKSFEATRRLDYVRIAISKNKNVILMKSYDPNVYVYDSTGSLKHKFAIGLDEMDIMNISDEDEIMIPSDDGKVRFYTEEGDLQSSISAPKGHIICDVAFHYGMGKIIILTRKIFYCLFSFSKRGKLENSTFFRKDTHFLPPKLTSHPSGFAAVAYENTVTFI